MRIPFISLAAIGALALGGCAYGDYGPGYGYGGYGYGNYGYGGGYYGGYAPYSGYGYGAFDPFGWYGADFYYPGEGVYVYDRGRRAHAWNSDQQHYWSGRRAQYQTRSGRTWSGSNWSGSAPDSLIGGAAPDQND